MTLVERSRAMLILRLIAVSVLPSSGHVPVTASVVQPLRRILWSTRVRSILYAELAGTSSSFSTRWLCSVRRLSLMRGRHSVAIDPPVRAVISVISVGSPSRPAVLAPRTRANPLSIVAMRRSRLLSGRRHDEQCHDADPCRDTRGYGEALPSAL